MPVVCVENKKEDSKIKLPALLISKTNRTVILAVDRRVVKDRYCYEGVVVKEGSNGPLFTERIGHFSEHWREDAFEIYTGKITLENEKSEV